MLLFPNLICVANAVFAGNREETGDHPGDHKLLTCKDAPADIQVTWQITRDSNEILAHGVVRTVCLVHHCAYMRGGERVSPVLATCVHGCL